MPIVFKIDMRRKISIQIHTVVETVFSFAMTIIGYGCYTTLQHSVKRLFSKGAYTEDKTLMTPTALHLCSNGLFHY